MDESEQAELQSATQSRFEIFKYAVGIALGFWAASSLLAAIVWVAVAWLVRVTIGSEIGWNSDLAPWIKSLGAIACAIYPVIAMGIWYRRETDFQAPRRLDLEEKQAFEEEYEFSAAMRMQEQEHGGLIYFLHSIDGTVLVLFDYESQDLGTNGEDPLTSSFEPRTQLTLVRAAKSGILIGTTFSGDVLDAGDPLDLMVSPEEWPEFEKVCDIPWQELEARLCR